MTNVEARAWRALHMWRATRDNLTLEDVRVCISPLLDRGARGLCTFAASTRLAALLNVAEQAMWL